MPLFEPKLQRKCPLRTWTWIMLAGCSVPTEGSGLETSIGAGHIPPLDAASPQTPVPVETDAGVPEAPDAAQDGGARPWLMEPPSTAADAAMASDDEAMPQPLCPAGGSFAVRTDMDVDWDQTLLAGIFPILEAGAGKLSLIELMRFETTGAGELVARVRQCGASVPQFEAALLGERYAVDFPDALWEAPQMPRWQLVLDQACFEPGCILESDPLDALLGLSLPDPAGPWPSRPNDPDITYLDHDGDGQPGITLTTRGPLQVDSTGHPFSHPPLNLLLIERASHIMLSIRMHTTLRAALVDCDHFSGMSQGTRLETLVGACIRKGEGVERPCDAEQAAFVDANMPVWKVRSTHWTGIRVPDDATCAQARRSFP